MASYLPTEINVFTWNTQGDFTTDVKFPEIHTLFTPGYSIGFIQEGGVRKANTYTIKDFCLTAYGGDCVGAFNERCTNYILIPSTMVDDKATCVILQDDAGKAVVGGGEAGRTPAAIGLNRILYVSWHSLASESNADTSELVHTIENNTHYYRDYDTVIIGGDFNASPDDIREVLLGGTERTKKKWNYNHRCVANSDKGTHKPSGKKLDFFIIMAKETIRVYPTSVTTKHVDPSDHCPVMMTIRFS